jgi:hypothetical protein
MKMKRSLIALTAAAALLVTGAAPASAFTVVPSPQNVTVDDQAVACAVYNIDGLNYFKLRDVAYFLKDTPSAFAVGYDAQANAVTVDTTVHTYEGQAPQGTATADPTAMPSPQKLIFDGALAEVSAYNINGNNYFQLRDLSSLLKVDVDYDAATNTAMIKSKAGQDPVKPDQPVQPVDTNVIQSWDNLTGLAAYIDAPVSSDSSSGAKVNVWYTLNDDKGTVAINNRVLGGRHSGEIHITGTDAVNVDGVVPGMTSAAAASALKAADWQNEGIFNGQTTYSLEKDGTSFLLYLTEEGGNVTSMKLTGRQG